MSAVVKQSERLGQRARARRWDKMLSVFPDLSDMRVLDLGGTPDFWSQAPVKPRAVHAVNLEPSWRGYDDGSVTYGCGDATEFEAEESYDLVVSNSLIEHVGGHAMRLRLANVIDRSAPRHWVQTPYRFFPVEPHWLAPAIQWFPFPARVALARRWPKGRPGVHHPERLKAADLVSWVELLTITEMEMYFPSSRIWVERFAGLPKSITAVRA